MITTRRTAPFFSSPLALSVVAGFTLWVGGCDDGGDSSEGPPADPEQVAEGARLYETPVEDGNTFACANCHAIDEDDGPRRAGHPLGGATRRDSYKNGQLDSFDDAVNSCLTEWMNADAWTDDDPRMAALRTFIDSESGSEDDIEYEVVEPPAVLAGGDVAAGRALFNDSCVVCHGEDGVGTERAIPVSTGMLEPGYIARRVRTSGRLQSDVYSGLTGGVMPFWAADRLSEDELLDIVAYLSRDYTPPDPDDPDDPDDPVDPDDPDDPNDPDDPVDPDDPDDPDDPPPSGCGDDHPKVGQTAELQELFHDVGGIAEIVDNCTIEIREFDFDGQGIDVQIYGGVAEGGGPVDYDNGFSMSDNLVRPMPYNAETVRFTLPEGMTLDDVDGVSVWCVPIGADFGSGTFQ